jgi:regulator of protease activity HflC (stomatin/prohibitin superfamily)
VTDDPSGTTQAVTGAAAVPGYRQIIESEAGPLEVGEAIELADAYGRVPVVVRVHRQPPINPIWILLAIGLGASGLFLPLFLAVRAIIIVAAVAVLIFGILARLIMRIPPGTVGLVAQAGRHHAVLNAGVRWVRPTLALTHVVTTRELAFDVPVAAVRSADGVNVNVDLVLTLGIDDPVKFAYQITSGDLDEFIHASCQEAVRLLVRGIEALAALDLGEAAADRLRQSIDAKLAAYGVGVRAVAFTRVLLPEALTASLEARRLASIQLSEEKENYALDERRLTDRANLLALEQESRHAQLELEAQAEALRLGKLEERLARYPLAARYDLEWQRLKVAQQLAGNTRAVVSLGGGDLVANLLAVQQAGATETPAAAGGNGTAGEALAPAADASNAATGDAGRGPAPDRGAVRRRTPG